jgi:hypothetical protein
LDLHRRLNFQSLEMTGAMLSNGWKKSGKQFPFLGIFANRIAP